MKKSIIHLFIIFNFTLTFLFAGERPQHDQYLRLLLGLPKSENDLKNISSEEEKNNYYLLSDALFLTLDYCKTQTSDKYKHEMKLKSENKARNNIINEKILIKGVRYEVPTLEEIVTPGGPYHEKYTHMGWNNQYKEKNQARWLKRKGILITVVNDVFDFWSIDENRTRNMLENEKNANHEQFSILEKGLELINSNSNSMAAILYYDHILVDIKLNTITTKDSRMSLSDIKEELKRYIPELIGEIEYNNCKKMVDTLNNNSSTVDDVLNILNEYFPKMIEDEKFFEKPFPSVA